MENFWEKRCFIRRPLLLTSGNGGEIQQKSQWWMWSAGFTFKANLGTFGSNQDQIENFTWYTECFRQYLAYYLYSKVLQLRTLIIFFTCQKMQSPSQRAEAEGRRPALANHKNRKSEHWLDHNQGKYVEAFQYQHHALKLSICSPLDQFSKLSYNIGTFPV